MKDKKVMMVITGWSGLQIQGNGIIVDCRKKNGVFGKINISGLLSKSGSEGQYCIIGR